MNVFILTVGVFCTLINDPAAAQPRAREDGATLHREDLRRCREGILDASAQPAQRRRWSEQLFSYDTAPSRAVTVELLEGDAAAEVHRALCDVVAEMARRRPQRLFDELVAPLVALLDHEAEDIRAASARALAGFSGPEVARELGQLASSPDEPLLKRLAAIDALAPNIHRRFVVEQLIGLLDAGVAEISARTVSALEPASRTPIGNNPAQWRTWWQQRKALSKATWLEDQIQIYRWRLKAISDQAEDQQTEQARRHAELARRMAEFQRDVVRFLPADVSNTRLVEWLGDPLDEVKQATIAIIRARIADDGVRPEGAVLESLLDLLATGTLGIRRDVLLIVQNLTDAPVVDRVVSVLQDETDPSMRQVLFQAIGRIGAAKAIPVLIQEIASHDANTACAEEAAIALGLLAGKGQATEDLGEAVVALRSRYALTSGQDYGLRAALLTAMAGVADASFEPAFVEALDSDESILVRPAIDGIRTLGIQSRMTRLRDLTGHSEPQIRLAAIETVGQLGKTDADIECLMARVNPAIENNQAARDSSWAALQSLTSRIAPSERVRAAERLRDTPQLEATYLENILADLPQGNGSAPVRDRVLSRLADIHTAEGRFGGAAQYLRLLYQAQVGRSDPQAVATGLRWLEASLYGFPQVSVSDVVVQFTTSSPINVVAPQALKLIQDYLDIHDKQDSSKRIRDLRADLATVELQETPDGFRISFPDATTDKSSPDSSSSSP